MYCMYVQKQPTLNQRHETSKLDVIDVEFAKLKYWSIFGCKMSQCRKVIGLCM